MQSDIIAQAVALLTTLKHNRLRHGDLKADNLWVHNQHVYLLDLDSLRSYRTTLFFKRAFEQDMKRFFDNWQDTPTLQQQFKMAWQEGLA